MGTILTLVTSVLKKSGKNEKKKVIYIIVDEND